MQNEYERQGEDVRADLKRNGETLVNVKEAVFTLLEKLTEVKLPSPEHRYSNMINDHFYFLTFAAWIKI